MKNPLLIDAYRQGAYNILEPVVGALANHYYDRIHVSGLKNIQNSQSNLYLMRHKSHFDYLLLNYILFRHQKEIPFIAARDNIFKYLFFGGIFNLVGRTIIIKSDVAKEDMAQYDAQLKAALKEIVDKKQDVAVFLEGGRNYKGGFGEPKSGIVKRVLAASQDMRVIPTNFEYSYVVESEFFEKLERAKKGSPEHILTDIWAFIKNGLEIALTQTDNGKIYLNFGQSFDLAEYLHDPQGHVKVCQRAWQEMKESYIPPDTALVAHEIDKIQQGKSDKTLEEIAKKHEKPFEILRARHVINREGNILNQYVLQHLLRNFAVKVVK